MGQRLLVQLIQLCTEFLGRLRALQLKPVIGTLELLFSSTAFCRCKGIAGTYVGVNNSFSIVNGSTSSHTFLTLS